MKKPWNNFTVMRCVAILFGALVCLIGSGILHQFDVIGEELSGILLSVFAVLIIFGAVLLCVIAVRGYKRNKRQRVALDLTYNGLVVPEQIDYKTELAIIQKNYDAEKEQFLTEIKRHVPLLSPKAYKEGKLCYGHLVMANNMLFYPSYSFLSQGAPGVVIYSFDEYFEEHPQDFEPLAAALFKDKRNNFLKNEQKRFYNLPLKYQIGGKEREIYATCIGFPRDMLPSACITGTIFPILANNSKTKYSVLVPDRFWSKELVAAYLGRVAKKEEGASIG